MRALLYDVGTLPVLREALTIFVMMGTNSAEHYFTSHVGMGSSSHDLFADFEISFDISSSDAGVSSLNCSFESSISKVLKSFVVWDIYCFLFTPPY